MRQTDGNSDDGLQQRYVSMFKRLINYCHVLIVGLVADWKVLFFAPDASFLYSISCLSEMQIQFVSIRPKGRIRIVVQADGGRPVSRQFGKGENVHWNDIM